MTLDQIETFLCVVECGSFKAASEKLFRSQPALSVSIKKLEQELEFDLFSREAYRPVLTEKGLLFLPRAKHLFQNAQSLLQFSRELSSDKERVLNIAIDSLCPLSEILAPIRDFMESEPDVNINLTNFMK